MNLRHSIIFPILAAILFTASSPASAQVVDGPIAWKHLKRQVRDMLYQEKFAELEKMARDFRTTKAKFPDGAWKLNRFYAAFTAPKNDTPDGWKRFLALFDKWFAKFPGSVTARCAAAEGWERYGWKARGTGYADKVTEDGWRLFYERLGKASTFVAEKPERASEDCPERHDLLLRFAIYQSAEREHFEVLFHDAVSFQPDYFYFYFDKAHYLLPRWHGNKGDAIQFALETTKLPPEKGGKILYADIVIQNWDNEFRLFTEDGISWALVKQGFIESRRQNPSSPWILNCACRFACLAGDREMAKELFKEIGDHPYIEAWSGLHRVSEYTKWKDWAFEGNKQVNQSQKPYFPGGTEDFREWLTLAKDGDAESQCKVGDMLMSGDFVEKNLPEAAKWLLEAARQGNCDSQSSLASVYFNGEQPMKKDLAAAAKWYYIAAMQGDSNAASLLGLMYKNGYGLEEDISKAYIWYSQVTQWKEPKVQEIADKLTTEQLAKANLEAKRIREEIRINMETAETRLIDPASFKVPEFKLVPQVKYEVVPQLKLPTGNLVNDIKWELSGEATFDGKTLSIKNQGEATAQMKVISSQNGCVLVATRLRHTRPEAIVPGTPFLIANMTDGNFDGQRIFMGLLAPPPNNRKEGPWYKTHEIKATRFDGVKLRFGTAGKQEGSSTEIYGTKVMIFPSCIDANKAGEEYLRQ